MSTVRTSTVRRRTDVDAVQTLRLAHEAVEFPHLSNAGPGPALHRDDSVDLVAERLNVPRRRCEMIQGVGNAL